MILIKHPRNWGLKEKEVRVAARKALRDLGYWESDTELSIVFMGKIRAKKLNIKYDIWFSEASLYKNGAYKKVMENLMQSDFIYEKDGATWMKTSGLGDSEDRVLVKSDGGETYFLSDILYHYDKFKVRKFDKVIESLAHQWPHLSLQSPTIQNIAIANIHTCLLSCDEKQVQYNKVLLVGPNHAYYAQNKL